MSLYPRHYTVPSNIRYATQWVERQDCVGYVRERTVTATEWVEVERTDCHCCSCSVDGFAVDPHCRNHGYYGERPCELHNMPGTAGDDGIMPDSVQVANGEVPSHN
jgi:hypothetical protein